MKKRIFSIIAFITLLITAFPLVACNDKDDKNEDLTVTDCVFSSFTAEDFNGNIIDQTVFADYKITMINVWGTYCSPCKTELPELAELNAEYSESGFQIIGIPIDAYHQAAADAIELIEETGANYRHIRISSSIKSFISKIKGVPYTIFVNKEGKQIGSAVSGAKSKADWKTLIDQMLEFVSE
ncbi:MAG: TlpA family protein disulfide reductase [Roseburia sp.]|nr:TlpA family protein disulfide reductase [Roseburia sp.]